MTAKTAIPVLSLQAPLDRLALQIQHAYSKTGFAYLHDHGVPQALIDGMFHQSREFHALPHTQKMQIEVNRWHRGFIPINTSTNRTSSIAKSTRPNQSESLMIMHESAPTAPSYLSGPNQWPKQLPTLKPIAQRYVAALTQVSKKLIAAFELVLGQSTGTMQQYFESPTTFLRLLRYPVQPQEPGLYGSAPHTDYGFLTLLTQDDTGGLQVRDTSGDWLDVPPRPACFILNAGDMLHRYSNGTLQSTPHRVINTADIERYSIAFFFDPHVDTMVSPLLSADETAHFESVRYGDYLRERLAKNHTQHSNNQ